MGSSSLAYVLAVLVALLALTSGLTSTVSAGLIDGIATTVGTYKMGAPLHATVDSFRSRRGLIPHNFYSVPIPKPDEKRLKDERVNENLGRVLMGSREQPSNYLFVVGNNVSCVHLGKGIFREKDMQRASYLSKNRYFGTIILDGLPVVTEVTTPRGHPGMRLGYLFGTETSINNFLHFTVKYALKGDGDDVLITGFSVVASSHNKIDECSATGFELGDTNTATLLPKDAKVTKETQWEYNFYYSVSWVEDPTGSVFSRMDVYDKTNTQKHRQRRGHWTAAINALLLATLLGVAVAVVIARTVRRDLLQYADEELADDLHEETGWKLVRGDVFRPPRQPVLFACVIAAGCQTLVMFVSAFVASILGVLHPSQRGNLLTGLIVCFLLASFAAGYVGARFLKFFKQRSWANGLLTVVAFPMTIVVWYLELNIIHWCKSSSSSIPFVTCLVLMVLWFALSMPLGVAGVTFGFRASAVTVHVRVSTIPRLIPLEATKQVGYHLFFGGLVPFSAGFIELVYVLAAFWQGERFHMLGSLAAVGVIIGILCGEVAVVVTYLALNHEDYRWWWRSFLSLFTAGGYLFCYSIFYLVKYLEVRLVSSVVLFFGYMFGISTLFGLICGTVGYLSAAVFVRFIYSAAKGD